MENLILKNNEMIAKFMGAIVRGSETFRIAGKIEFPNRPFKSCAVKDLQYHNSWDWLMPVIDKIEFHSEPEVRFVIFPDETLLQELDYDSKFNHRDNTCGPNRLTNLYNCVVEYIRDHNSANNIK